jgi:hypothetical protein
VTGRHSLAAGVAYRSQLHPTFICRDTLDGMGVLGTDSMSSGTPGFSSTPCFHGSPGLRAHLWMRNSPDQVLMWGLAYAVGRELSVGRERVVHKWCMNRSWSAIGVLSRSS